MSDLSGGGWTLTDAVELCKKIEAICPRFGCHVALTGGALYKDGPRKDLDILFYRIRQVDRIDEAGLFDALAQVGLAKVGGFGWCHKAMCGDRQVDCFFPETDGGAYEEWLASRQQQTAQIVERDYANF